jgi:hypothetical protein
MNHATPYVCRKMNLISLTLLAAANFSLLSFMQAGTLIQDGKLRCAPKRQLLHKMRIGLITIFGLSLRFQQNEMKNLESRYILIDEHLYNLIKFRPLAINCMRKKATSMLLFDRFAGLDFKTVYEY